MPCELCKAEKITYWLYEDKTCWIAKCKNHPSKWIIVLCRHTKTPTAKELGYILKQADFRLPKIKWREAKSILDHFHIHEV